VNPVTKTFQYGGQYRHAGDGPYRPSGDRRRAGHRGEHQRAGDRRGREDPARRAGTSSRSPSTTRRRPTPPARYPAAFSSARRRPSEKETLTSRLIDRPIRPLFADGFMNEVQVVCTVMSADKHVDPDIPAMIGTSAALAISGVPSTARSVRRASASRSRGLPAQSRPTPSSAGSKLDMVVAGTADAVLMVESAGGRADRRPDARRRALRAPGNAGRHQGRSRNWPAKPASRAGTGGPPAVNAELLAASRRRYGDDLGEAYRITEKAERYARVGEIREACIAALAAEDGPQHRRGQGPVQEGREERPRAQAHPRR
jgi:polyribonucleotide nucleotidyltransferase